jgi:hypothetical protein
LLIAGAAVARSSLAGCGDLDSAFARLAELPDKALLVAADPFFNTRREKLIETHQPRPFVPVPSLLITLWERRGGNG